MIEGKKKHIIQKLMDNPWLLLVLGVIIPFISYTVSINAKEISQVITDDNRLILDIVPNLHKLSIKQNT